MPAPRFSERRFHLAAVAFSVVLGACSGGGGSSPPVPGTFDKAFAREGLFDMAGPAFINLHSSANSVDIAPDGKLLVAGQADPPSSLYVRIQPGGELDTTFSGTGYARFTADLHFGVKKGRRALPAANGKIVFVEYSVSCLHPVYCVIAAPSTTTTRRVDANGAVDVTFEPANFALDAKQSFAEPEGTVLVLGLRPEGVEPFTAFGLERIGVDGRPDAAFAQNAAAASECTGTHDTGVVSVGMARQPDGRIVVAKRSVLSGAVDSDLPLCVFRLNRDGTLDASFNSGGRNFLDDPVVSRSDIVAILPRGDGGNILVLDFHRAQDDAAAVMFVWLAPDGTVDYTRGTYGIKVVDGVVRAAAAAIDGQGRILLAGFRSDDPTAAWPYPWAPDDPLLVRLNPDGMRDATFGTRGFGIAPLGVPGKLIQPNGIAVAPDGSIFVAGFVGLLSDPLNGVATTLAVAKLHGGLR